LVILNVRGMTIISITNGGSFLFGKSGDSPFYFPDREKNVKIVPVREIKWSIFICLSRSTDRSDDFTSQILNELSRISPTGILLNWVVFEKYVLKVGSFLAQLGIFTTFPFRAAYFLNSKVVIILFFQFLCEKAGKIYSLFSVLF